MYSIGDCMQQSGWHINVVQARRAGRGSCVEPVCVSGGRARDAEAHGAPVLRHVGEQRACFRARCLCWCRAGCEEECALRTVPPPCPRRAQVNADTFVADVRSAVERVRASKPGACAACARAIPRGVRCVRTSRGTHARAPGEFKNGLASIYGLAEALPDRGIVDQVRTPARAAGAHASHTREMRAAPPQLCKGVMDVLYEV